jgi:RNA polymerase sigma-70 factor (ECF subfamily)
MTVSTRPPPDLAPAEGDVALLAAVAAGDAAAVDRLLDHVSPAVYGFILARVGGQAMVAEDLLQETLLEGLRSRHTFRGDSALGTWLCSIARRRVARHYEAERRADLARDGLRQLPVTEAADEEGAVDQRDEVMAALGRLPALHRQVLVLKYLDGLSVEQIASETGKSPVQVQSLLQRSRDGLRRQLEARHG